MGKRRRGQLMEAPREGQQVRQQTHQQNSLSVTGKKSGGSWARSRGAEAVQRGAGGACSGFRSNDMVTNAGARRIAAASERRQRIPSGHFSCRRCERVLVSKPHRPVRKSGLHRLSCSNHAQNGQSYKKS